MFPSFDCPLSLQSQFAGRHSMQVLCSIDGQVIRVIVQIAYNYCSAMPLLLFCKMDLASQIAYSLLAILFSILTLRAFQMGSDNEQG